MQIGFSLANFFHCRPPGAVTNVTAAVMVLMATNGKIPKDRSWKQAKMMMAKVDAFLDALITYDKEHIHSDVIKVDWTEQNNNNHANIYA